MAAFINKTSKAVKKYWSEFKTLAKNYNKNLKAQQSKNKIDENS